MTNNLRIKFDKIAPGAQVETRDRKTLFSGLIKLQLLGDETLEKALGWIPSNPLARSWGTATFARETDVGGAKGFVRGRQNLAVWNSASLAVNVLSHFPRSTTVAQFREIIQSR